MLALAERRAMVNAKIGESTNRIVLLLTIIYYLLVPTRPATILDTTYLIQILSTANFCEKHMC